jgi:hypothetical protein
MSDSDGGPPDLRDDGIPELLPDRDELARAQVAAYWMATGDRGPLDAGLMRVEVCTRSLHLADITHEAAPGNRLRLRLRHATQKVSIIEERDTGSVFVWDTLAPTDSAARHSSSTAGAGPLDATKLAVADERGPDDEWARVAETVLSAGVRAMLGGLPDEDRERFGELVGKLPWLLHSLRCWDAFYGRAVPTMDGLAFGALVGSVRPDEVALVALVGGLAHWYAEATLRAAVAAVADSARSELCSGVAS